MGHRLKAAIPLGRIFFPIAYDSRWIVINSAIANNPKPIRMMKMKSVTIYPNIYECVSDYMKIHYDRFGTFCERSKIAED